jgi:hypothetical protein
MELNEFDAQVDPNTPVQEELQEPAEYIEHLQETESEEEPHLR